MTTRSAHRPYERRPLSPKSDQQEMYASKSDLVASKSISFDQRLASIMEDKPKSPKHKPPQAEEDHDEQFEQHVRESVLKLVERMKQMKYDGSDSEGEEDSIPVPPHLSPNSSAIGQDTLQHMSRFISLLQQTGAHDVLAQELQEIVQNDSSESLECKLSPDTMQALSRFIDELQKARRGETFEADIYPTSVFVPKLSDPNEEDPVDPEGEIPNIPSTLSIVTNDLDKETIAMLAEYIDSLQRSLARKDVSDEDSVGESYDDTIEESIERSVEASPALNLLPAVSAAREEAASMNPTPKRRDPPTRLESLSDDASNREDPPLFSSLSQEPDRIAGLPEVNPRKFLMQVQTSGETNWGNQTVTEPLSTRSQRSRDPDVCMDEIRIDMSGELNIRHKSISPIVDHKEPASTKAVQKRASQQTVGDSKLDEMELGNQRSSKPADKLRQVLSLESVPSDENLRLLSIESNPTNKVTDEKPVSSPICCRELLWETGKDDRQKNNPSSPYTPGDLHVRIENLFAMLTERNDPSPADLAQLTELVRLSFPLFDEKQQPASRDIARIQIQARKQDIPVGLTNTFLNSLRTLKQQEIALDIKRDPPSDAVLLNLSTEERMDILLQRVLAVKEAESRRNVLIYSTILGSGSNEGEAVEVDLNGDFDFVAKSYEDSEVSDGAPWWEAAAKLVRQTKQFSMLSGDNSDASMSKDCSGPSRDPPGGSYEVTQDSLSTRESSAKPSLSLEDDIIMFWREQKEVQKQQNPVKKVWSPKKSIHPAAPFSAADNECSLTTGTFSSLDSDEFAWIRKRSYARWARNQRWLPSSGSAQADISVGEPGSIDAVAAVEHYKTHMFTKRNPCIPITSQWKRPYKIRTKAHSGYFNVNVRSLYESTAVNKAPHVLDNKPWEHRDVKQRFLHEQSISYSRNWFGAARKYYGNMRIEQPVCRPKSMEMPMKADEWTEEWYRQPWTLRTSSQSADSDEAKEMEAIRRQYRVSKELDDENLSWEETPECGTIRNVKLRIGERISRVTPNFTSSLRRSRWRKKHFPKGTFPYK